MELGKKYYFEELVIKKKKKSLKDARCEEVNHCFFRLWEILNSSNFQFLTVLTESYLNLIYLILITIMT